jgi:hypothetical protein
MFGPRVALARKAMRFTAAQRALMNAYYSQGMVGTGKKHRRLIKKAANDAGLSTPQVKVSRYKVSYTFSYCLLLLISVGLRKQITKEVMLILRHKSVPPKEKE